MRVRLGEARLILLFTPGLALGREPLAALEACLPWVDVVQVRPKALGRSEAPAAARECFDWGERVLALDAVRRAGTLVIVDDRLDVARALAERGCAGAHVGEHDTPLDVARAFLGPDLLLGFSTHSLEEVVRAEDSPADYVGFGPAYATGTKGYERGHGPEACWLASQGSSLPLFAIGGIDVENANELARVGRAAVGSAILGADDPAAAARAIRAALTSVDV